LEKGKFDKVYNGAAVPQSRHYPGMSVASGKNHKAGVPAVIQTSYIPSLYLEQFSYISLLRL